MRGFLMAILVITSGLASSSPSMIPVDLRCEFRREPLGVDDEQPRLSWALDAVGDAKNLKQTTYRILVASSKDLLRRDRGDCWDSGRVASAEQTNIPYGGRHLQPGRAYFWKVEVASNRGDSTWSKVATWETGLGKSWKARWIDDGRENPTKPEDAYKDDPAPIFRKEFRVDKPIKRARLYITGLGYYEPSLNGKRIGDHVLDPGWTRFDKRTFYSVFDVEKHLIRGENCIGVMLGSGWYNPLPLRLFGAFDLREHLPTGRPRLIAELHLEYRDGSRETISTDRTWRVGRGPILRNNIYLGEVYDARLEQSGWDRAGFDDGEWKPATLAKSKLGPLVTQPQPPVRITKKWKAVKVSQPKRRTYIYDLGANFSGWVRLDLNLPRGTTLKMRYGELLYPDGRLNPMTSVAGQIKGFKENTKESVGGPGAPEIAWQGDTFIAKGGPESYTPRFTWHGFRYVEIEGLPTPLPLSAVTGMRLNSDVEDAGDFECSNPMLNQIQAICERTFKSNIFSVQSDCPHRERLGYGGDIVATSQALMGNFDMATFYEKTVRDWTDSARADGMFTDTAPFIGIQYCGVIWAMAHPHLIEDLYRYYGGRRLTVQEYANARRWLALVEAKYPDGIITEGLSDHESLVETPSPDLVTPMYFESVKLLAAQAKRLGRKADVAHLEELGQKIRSAYASKFIDTETGKVGLGSQAAQAFALHTGIAPEPARSKVLEFLIADVEAKKGHLTTGILGTKFVLDVLSREGHADVAYRIVTQPDFPGWGWMLKNGATTLWEHWEYSDNTFSHNHPMFGSVSQWMMQWLGGIQPAPESTGFDRVTIQPQYLDDLTWVKSSYRSVRGKIVSNWTRMPNGQVVVEVVIPPNVDAEVFLPGGSKKKLGSGRYVF